MSEETWNWNWFIYFSYSYRSRGCKDRRVEATGNPLWSLLYFISTFLEFILPWISDTSAAVIVVDDCHLVITTVNAPNCFVTFVNGISLKGGCESYPFFFFNLQHSVEISEAAEAHSKGQIIHVSALKGQNINALYWSSNPIPVTAQMHWTFSIRLCGFKH